MVSHALCLLDQAKINAILEEIFKIKTGFIGKLVSNLARVRGESQFRILSKVVVHDGSL